MDKIKNIVFDLGGVIMNLNVPKTIEKFERLGITNIVNSSGHHYTDSVFYDFEIGVVSEDEFVNKLLGMSNSNVTYKNVKEAWNAMILNMPKERIELLISLKKNYRLFLLSNTNSIHQEKFEREFIINNGYNFKDLFNKVYYSHQVGIRKPEEKIFRFVLKSSKIEAKETLFIDDSFENIEVAQKAGIQTYHINSKNTLNSLFNT